jgi:type II restriction enzyme
MDLRKLEMESDNKDHYLIYAVLGVNEEEGQKIDLYQNMGRFLYKYAGSFLEEVAIFCFKYKHPNAKAKEKLKNTIGVKPKTFEIDLLFDNKAHEIKWRDATTDGDHITKEHTRVKVIQSYGYQPIRVMFYYPNRSQAIRIQETLKTLYSGVGGIYYSGDDAWEYLKSETGIDLKEILIKIAEEKHNGKN